MAVLILVVVLMMFVGIVITLARPRPERRRTPDTSFVSSETTDTGWNTTAAVVALDAADDAHSTRHHSDGEAGWGEHGASSSWSEAGEGGGYDGGGDSGGSDGGGSSND